MHNVIALYGMQVCTYILPVITFPYLARVLGPSGLGAVVFSQAIGTIIIIAVEYGFDVSATRETSRLSNDRHRLSELVAGVLGAKLVLAGVCVCGALIARPYTLHIAPSPALFWSSVAWAIGQGVNMLWYFQGLERMRVSSGLDIGGKVLATLSIFLVVHKASDGWKVMAAQALGCLVSHAATVWMAYREVGFRWPTPALVGSALRLGWAMFLFRAAQSLITTVNGLILGIFASPAALGMYAGAEKIVRVPQQAIWPLNQALYPRLSHKVHHDANSAARIVRLSLAAQTGLGVLCTTALFFAAPVLVRIILGPAFESCVPTLRVFAFLIPLNAACTVLSFQWILPHRLDRQFNIVVFTSGLLNVAMGVLLAPKLFEFGMALAVLITAVYSTFGFLIMLQRARLSPFSRTESNAAVEYQHETEAQIVL